MRLPRYWAGIARASFWDLCGQPLGPADYLALVGAVKLLVLEGIPRLDASKIQRGETLRHAGRCALRGACTADLLGRGWRPEQLYLEGSRSFEFERTASRLREMQGCGLGQRARRAGLSRACRVPAPGGRMTILTIRGR